MTLSHVQGDSLMLDTHGATINHWKQLKAIRSVPVEPREFREKWNITNEQIAKLLDLSTGHVVCWFFNADAVRYRAPEEKHKRRLAEIDYIWSNLEKIPQHIRQYYNEFKD